MNESESKLDKATVYRRIKYAVRLTQDEKYAEALRLFEMYLPLLSSGADEEKRLLTRSSSYCGVCLAVERHRFKEAFEYCQISLNGDLPDPDHHVNVALVYLQRNDRRMAVKHLHAGLELQPKHSRSHVLLYKIGRRHQPVIPFLSRSNRINVWLGRRRAGRRPSPRRA
jgi:tetratricopeptide (TPR) repeat protein